MKYVYPAIFRPVENGQFDVKIPDLPGCRTCGSNLVDAILMAEDAAAMWLWDAECKKEDIPIAKGTPRIQSPQFVSYIIADTDKYRKENDSHAVKKTLSIPSWLNEQAEEAGINFSQTLQTALKEKLHLK